MFEKKSVPLTTKNENSEAKEQLSNQLHIARTLACSIPSHSPPLAQRLKVNLSKKPNGHLLVHGPSRPGHLINKFMGTKSKLNYMYLSMG